MESAKLIVTKSGHYTIHIDPYNTILTNVVSGVNPYVILTATDNIKSRSDADLKLHKKFAHPVTEWLLRLLNSANNLSIRIIVWNSVHNKCTTQKEEW